MRFTNNFDLFKTMRVGSQRLLRVFTMPIYVVYRKVIRFVNPNGIMTRVIGDVRKGFRKTISAKPESLKDYFALPKHYVAKKLVFVMALILILLPVGYIHFIHPMVESNFMTKTMSLNATQMMGYTGKVKLLSNDDGKTIYKGKMEGGRITGKGTLYDENGKLAYTGNFLTEMYEGEGETYFPNGKVQYKGGFSKNKYEGAGVLYGNQGNLKYEGEFKAGVYNGTGSVYYNNGQLLYSGVFENGLASGNGTLYGGDGNIVYVGDMKNGKFDGNGTVYEDGKVLYQGELALGKMNGKGVIYSGKNIIYDGEFEDSNYSGAGKLYDPVTLKLLYDGEFKDGKYSGVGKLFDPQERLVYDGGFYNGSYEGEGTIFDVDTGYSVYKGTLRAGRYDGDGVEYELGTGALLYEGGFLLGAYNGKGVLYDSFTGEVVKSGVFNASNSMVGTLPEIDGEEGKNEGEGKDEGEGNEGSDGENGTPGETINPGGEVKPGAEVYSGPKKDGAVDVAALILLSEEKTKAAFGMEPAVWELDSGNATVYEDVTGGIGLTIQSDGKGKVLGADIWNDKKTLGVSPGMKKDEITAVLGQPLSESTEIMGESRLVSVSQSNRFHNRLTNISAESNISVVKYKVDSQYIQAIFIPGEEGALIIEVRN